MSNLFVPPTEPEHFDRLLVNNPDNSITAREPFGGEEMLPGVVPEAVRTWPGHAPGFEFWGSEGHRTTVTLSLADYDRPETFAGQGLGLHAEARRLKAANGILFLSGGIWEGSETEPVMNKISQGKLTPLSPWRSAEDSGQAIMEQIAGTGVNIAMPDFRHAQTHEGIATNPMALYHNTLALWIIAQIQAGARGSFGADRELGHFMGTTHLRLCTMLGQMGLTAAKLDPERPVELGIVLPTEFQSFANLVASHGGNVLIRGERAPARPLSSVQTAVLGKMVINRDEARRYQIARSATPKPRR